MTDSSGGPIAKLQQSCRRLQRISFGQEATRPSSEGSWRPTSYFTGIVLFYAVFMLVMNEWVLSGEMLAEMGMNYFPHAQSSDPLVRFFAMDAGYVPLLQRLIAASAAALHVSAERVPFVYTWSAILFSGVIVGAFSLAPFRSLIRSDGARALACVAVLISANWMTATFINFTHFNLFIIAAFIAAALVEQGDDAPVWAWCLPLLMVSKPYVLAAIPAAAVAVLVAKPRYRRILLVAILAAAAQMIRMIVSRQQGVSWDGAHEYTVAEKIWVGLTSSVGFLGEYTIGPSGSLPSYAVGPWVIVVAGITVIAAAAATLWLRPHPSMAAVVVGLSIVFPTFLINSFVFPGEFNPELDAIRRLHVNRHTLPGFIGTVLVVIGLLAVWTDGREWNFGGRSFSGSARHATAVSIWILVSGWATTGAGISKPPPFPVTNHSQWQRMATSIEDHRKPVCVPLDPIGWIYGRGCRMLERFVYAGGGRFEPLPAQEGVEVYVPASVTTATLLSLGIPIRPVHNTERTIRLTAIVELASGESVEFSGERTLDPEGGLILLDSGHPDGVPGIRRARIFSDAPVEFFFLEAADEPAIEWMGR